MFQLWRTRSLGNAMPKESNSAAISLQCPSKIECTLARSKQPWTASCLVWKGEPPRGRHSSGDPGVALGTFLVESHSANVLFDTGATHSFVTASWVETHNIPVAPMYPPMRVSSVGVRTQTDKFCPSARVQIRG
jgi:hypothetical protein